MEAGNRGALGGLALLLLAACGAETQDVSVVSIVSGGECHGYLTLQCACCGSGKSNCEQYVDLLVADGDAYTNSTESECKARRAQVTDVTTWCAATFTTTAAVRAACQGFPPGSGLSGDATAGGG